MTGDGSRVRTRVGVTALDLANIHGNPRLSQLRAELIATAHTDGPEPVRSPMSLGDGGGRYR
jgi:hypothetical protein